MRVITRKDIKPKTGYTYHYCVILEKRGEFPRRIKLGPKRVGWLEHEIDEWLQKRQRVLDAA